MKHFFTFTEAYARYYVTMVRPGDMLNALKYTGVETLLEIGYEDPATYVHTQIGFIMVSVITDADAELGLKLQLKDAIPDVVLGANAINGIKNFIKSENARFNASKFGNVADIIRDMRKAFATGDTRTLGELLNSAALTDLIGTN